MGRYLEFVLEGVLPSAVRARIGRVADVDVQDGRSFVRVRDLPRDDLEDVISDIGTVGLTRKGKTFDVGVEPKHKDSPNERIIAYRLDADEVDRPANPEDGFRTACPTYQRSRLSKTERYDGRHEEAARACGSRWPRPHRR